MSAALTNEFEKKSQTGDCLLKTSRNKMVIYFIALKFIDEVIQRAVDSKAVN